MKHIIVILLVVGLIAACNQKKAHPYASIKPIKIPILFNIKGNENLFASNITFTPDGNELYFVTDSAGIEIIKSSCFLDKNWSDAKQTDFSGKYRIENPRISPDGKRFFFCRPTNNYATCDIYVMDKTSGGWSNPKPIDSIINNHSFNMSPTCDQKGNLFFCSNRNGGWKAFCSKYENGTYTEPVPLDTSINKYSVFELFIAPDESYLLFGWYVSENNWRDIYISFKLNNTWSTALSLGNKINSNEYEGRPCISPDGNYLFYSKGMPTKIYQVEWKPLLDSLKRSL